MPAFLPFTEENIEKLKKELPTRKSLLKSAIEKYLGKDVSEEILKRDIVSDNVACVETVCLVLREFMEFPLLTYTPTLVSHLKKDKNFEGTLEIEPLSIIVNATGSGNGSMPGHAGFIWFDDKIASNNSDNGKLELRYTIDSWRKKFRIEGGMPTLVFRLV
jgi:hypothetical protein